MESIELIDRGGEMNADAPGTVAEVADTRSEPCWFCESATAVGTCARKVSLYGGVRVVDVKRTSTGNLQVNQSFRLLEFPVPRCTACASVHERRALFKILFGFGSFFGVAIPVWRSPSGGDEWIAALVLGGLAALLGGFIGKLAGRGMISSFVRADDDAREYPAVRDLLDSGWKLGNRPESGEGYPRS